MHSLQRFLATSLLILGTGLWSGTSSADIFVKYNTVNGDVTEPGFNDFVRFDSFQWGLQRAVDLIGGGGGGGSTIGPPFSSEVSLSKTFDIASSGLAAEFLAGGASPYVRISLTTGAPGSMLETVRLELCNVVMTSLSSSSAGGLPSESLSVAFTRFKLTHFLLGGKGGGVSGTPLTWDFVTASPGASCNAP